MNALRWRRPGLFGALAATIVLSAFSGKQANTSDKPAGAPRNALAQAPRAPAQMRRSPAPPVPRIELERLPRHDASVDADAASEAVASNTFGAMSWHVPPPPPPPAPVVKPPPPPPPSAPPVPFTFMGRYEDGAVRVILLIKDDRIYTVSEGDVIDNTYRVERLAAGQLELTYLPLGTKQRISAEGT